MKTILFIFIIITNACYGQDTAFYNKNTPNYVDSALNYWHANIELIDSIFYDGDTTHMILKYHKDGKYYTDTIYLIPQPELKWYDGVIISDSVTMYGNEPPVYHRKKDTVQVIIQYSNIEIQEMVGWTNGIEYEFKDYDWSVKWRKVYSVRELHNIYEAEFSNGQIGYSGMGGYKRENNYWKHLYYLDSNKQKLSKSTIVWQSIEVK